MHENSQKIKLISSASSDTMNNQNTKASLRTPRNEMSDIITKHQDISKSGTTTIRGKTDAVTNSRIPSGSLVYSNSPSRIYSKTNNKTKAMGSVSKTSSKESKGGVHEFIMNVSNYIEKNNYHKESGPQQQSRTLRKRSDFSSVNSVQFNNGVHKKTEEKRKPEKIESDSKKIAQVVKPWEKNSLNTESSRRKENLQHSRPRDIRLNENNFEHPQKLRYSNLDLTRDIHEYLENDHRRKTSPVRMRPNTPLCDNDLMRKRPSEIPLRKTRKSPRRPSTSSLPKSFREAEGGGSFFPNFDDFDLQSEFQMTFNFNFDTDDFSTLGKKDSDRILNALAHEICSLPEDTLFLEKLLSDKPSMKKGKSIPESKELSSRTSSFTVLSKLESLHKQTLAERKRISKTTLNLRKVDKTKKKSQLQSESKESKLGLKIKTKKGKETEKETQDKSTKEPKRKVSDSSKPKAEPKKPDPWVSVFMKADPPKKEENKYSKKSVPSKQKSTEFAGSLKEKDSGKGSLKFLRQGFEKSEKPKTARSSCENSRSGNYLKSSNSEEKSTRLKSDKNPRFISPSTHDNIFSSNKCEDDKEWSVKSLLCVDKLTSGNSQTRLPKSPEKKVETPQETSEPATNNLIVKGKSLKTLKDEPSEKLEETDQPAGKKHLKIDLRTPEDLSGAEMLEENPEDKSAFDWFLMDEGICLEETAGEKPDWEKCLNGETFSRKAAHLALLSFGYSPSCKSLKENSSTSPKTVKKEKIRSDAGDRPFSGSLFNSDMTRHNKVKPDSKLRSGLRKSFNREDARDTLEDSALLKLKRRNSEPISFRGYILKCVDRPIPKDHKASVSSMTSSLRHLNTDEIDDFILWEAIPQKMTCWWEMSLYNCKRTWSVLSSTVFKDNRKSSTPGLILENLRSGITSNTRDTTRIQKDRAACRKENPFDVEPSIAQKNIDIRNWLAALNFPTPPSTSTEIIAEGNFSSQPKIDSVTTPKSGAKRRKTHICSEDRCEDSRKRNCRETEILPEITRRKSGGFLTQEQLISQTPTHRTTHLSHSKSAEANGLIIHPRKYKSLETTQQSEIFWHPAVCSENLIVTSVGIQEEGSKIAMRGTHFGNVFKGDLNIWKYLFFLTLFMILAHYCFLTSVSCRL